MLLFNRLKGAARLAAVTAFAVGGFTATAEAASISITPGAAEGATTLTGTGSACGGGSSFGSFTSCTSSGNAKADTVEGALSAELTNYSEVDLTGGYYPGKPDGDITKLGSEFEGGDTNTFTFSGLPEDTLFISLKQGNAFEIFNVAQYASRDMLLAVTHTLGTDTSNIAIWTGSVPGVAPVPLPAAGLLFAPALAGLYAAGRLRRKKTGAAAAPAAAQTA